MAIEHNSVTQWIHDLKQNSDYAAQKLYSRYITRLMLLGRRKLGDASRREADEEDLALVVLGNFFQGVKEGRFPKLVDRNDLWQVLVMLTERKAVDHKRRVWSTKRRSLGESAIGIGADTDSPVGGIQEVIGSVPTPECAAMILEECNRRLRLLDPTLREIALQKMKGWTSEEIADEAGCVPRTIERKLNLIRRIWSEHGLESAASD
jgi:DNA-directed RNA polymerase specialized sigma24 family protein